MLYHAFDKIDTWLRSSSVVLYISHMHLPGKLHSLLLMELLVLSSGRADRNMKVSPLQSVDLMARELVKGHPKLREPLGRAFVYIRLSN